LIRVLGHEFLSAVSCYRYCTPDIIRMISSDDEYLICWAPYRFVIDFTDHKVYRDLWYQDRWVRYGYYPILISPVVATSEGYL
jgi:hypothetical protein